MITKTKFKQTEMGKNPEDWEEHTLGEFIDVLSGFAFKSSDFSNKEGIPIIKIKNITPPIVSLRGVQYYNRPINSKIKKYIVRKNDILISMTGSNVNQMASAVGKIARYNLNLPALLNQRVGKLIINDKTIADEDYVYLFVSRMEVQYYLAINASGSANQANISPDTIESIKIVLPPLPEQIAIAKILSDLDSKIELLQKQNKTLEAIAQALFKHWFVDFEFPNEEGNPYKSSGGEMIFNEELQREIPKGWESRRLEELFKFVKGKKPRRVSEQYNEDYLLQILIETLDGKNPVFADPEKMILVDKKNPIMVMDGASSGRIEIGFIGILGSTLALLKINNSDFNNIVYYFLKTKEEDINKNTTGTSIPHTDKNKVYNYEVSLPENNNLANRFQKETSIIISKITLNKEKIGSLQKIRDSLLPKLMSGKIRVPVEVE